MRHIHRLPDGVGTNEVLTGATNSSHGVKDWFECAHIATVCHSLPQATVFCHVLPHTFPCKLVSLHSAKGGAVETGVVYIILQAVLLYTATPIHSPLKLHPPLMNTQLGGIAALL